MSNKKVVLILAFFFLFLSVSIRIVYGEELKRPNIILITLDSLRADHLSCYGYSKTTSPFLDSFSKTALVFTDCITQSGSTVPAMSALFTSRFPFLDGAVTSAFTLGNKYLTLAAFLKNEGYNTFAVLGHMYVKKKFGFYQGFDYYDDNFEKYRNSDEMFHQVKNLFLNNKINKKFFLWIHVREPHCPYAPPKKYISKFSAVKTEGLEKKEIYAIYDEKRLLSKQEIERLIAAYDGNIRYADEYLSRVFGFLKKLGLYNNTVIIITADHGESLGEHNIFNHNSLFYGILHVPLVVKIPGSKGGLISEPVSSIDIFPTILDILGYSNKIAQMGLRGKSLLERRKTDYAQFSEYPDIYSIIKKGWRLQVDNVNHVNNLFNVKNDPQESVDFIESNMDIYEMLQESLRALLEEGPQITATINKKAVLNDDDIKNLKSLGYLQ